MLKHVLHRMAKQSMLSVCVMLEKGGDYPGDPSYRKSRSVACDFMVIVFLANRLHACTMKMRMWVSDVMYFL